MANKKNNDELLQSLNLRRDLAKRFSKERIKEIKKWIKDYEIETILEANIKDLANKIQIPYIFSTVESGLPTIFERMPQLVITQRGRLDREISEFVAKIWDYLVERLDLESKVEDAGIMFKVIGMAHAKYGWELKTKKVVEEKEVQIQTPDGQTVSQTVQQEIEVPIVNQPFVEILGYDEIYFSPESKFVVDDDDNSIPYIVLKYVKRKEEVEFQYDVELDDDEVSTIDFNKIEEDGREIDKLTEKVQGRDDFKRVELYEYYGVLTKEQANDKDWTPDKVYYIAFTKNKILDGPKEFPKKPIINLGNYGFPTKFFKFGEAKVLRELEHDISLGRSRMMDIRDKYGTKVAIPQGTEVDEAALKKPADFTIMRFTGQQPPVYVTPPPIPESIMMALQQSREDIQMASAMLDISRGGTQSVVKTATGQTIFAQASEKRLNRQKKKIAQFIKAIAKNLLTLCGYNWDEEELSRITDIPVKEIQQKGFLEKLKQIGEVYDIKIDIESVTINRETLSAQAIALYREVKDDPRVNAIEVLKHALKVGFNIEDYDRFLNEQLTPEQMMMAIQQLVQMGVLPPETAQQVMMMMQQQPQMPGQPQPQGEVGRPAVQSPTDILNKSMPAASPLQIAAQTRAAYKQQGVSKGPQNIT
ncbi:MAG: hypothetical protein QXY47_05450 [Thermoplasmata archaeon]